MINTIGKTSGLEVQPTASARPSMTQLTSLDTTRMRFSFGRLLLAELRLLRKGLRRWWLLVAAVLILAGALAPIDVARQYLLPFTWLWPLLIWSALGTRETRHNTTGLVFSAANPLSRQLPATWLTGVLVTALAGSPLALNLLRSGDSTGLAAWTAAVLFIPSLALALAVWSGSSKLKVNAGAATLRLVVPADIAASVEVHRGPSGLKTEGEWAVNGRTYTTDNSDPSWSILLEMGVGSLTLVAE